MMNNINYISEAKKHEAQFRLILDQFNVDHANMSINEIYEKYSDGDRDGKWTIINFYEEEEGVFLFSSEDIAFLSGRGSSDSWKIEDGRAVKIGSKVVWMS